MDNPQDLINRRAQMLTDLHTTAMDGVPEEGISSTAASVVPATRVEPLPPMPPSVD